MYRASTVCFCPHLPQEFPFPFNEDCGRLAQLQNAIEVSLFHLIKNGYHRFLCGLAPGFDLTCADILLDIRECNQYKNIYLGCVLPYVGYTVPHSWQRLFQLVMACSSHVQILNIHTPFQCQLETCNYLLKNAGLLLCCRKTLQIPIGKCKNLQSRKAWCSKPAI